MIPLEKSLRTKLERTIQDARDVAEKAAEAVLLQLGVSLPKPPVHLSEEEMELRRKLVIHARQLGDKPDSDSNVLEIGYIKEEIAYEHWHRMLFARFLAENSLLMYMLEDEDRDNPVPVTLSECNELASSLGFNSGWALAAKFAQRMLPQIFRIDSPIFLLHLPAEYRNKLEQYVSELPIEVFTASDSLGWVYQYWQSRKKDAINKSEAKIGARELPPVTQLFTEPYMVQFLLDNALGAWWVARQLLPSDFAIAETEEELRQKASIPGVPLKYLRFTRNENGIWVPIGGTFEQWPSHLSQLKILDPCCGSGHFLVAALLMLVPMRMKMENLTADQAIDAVLSENLHGLELDPRCVEIAAFALAFSAWRFPGSSSFRTLPPLNIACSGLSINTPKDDLMKMIGDDATLQYHIENLYELFQDAPVIGSLINPVTITKMKSENKSLFPLNWKKLQPLLKNIISKETLEEKKEAGVVAHGLSIAAQLLMEKYHLIITNVPYLSRNKQNKILKEFCEEHYKESKSDLATVFLERCLEFCRVDGNVSVVLPQNWTFLSYYKVFRAKLLNNQSFQILAFLGAGAFETISGEVVQVILTSINQRNGISIIENLFKEVKSHSPIINGLDVSSIRATREKEEQLAYTKIILINQLRQLNDPDAIITLYELNNTNLLNKYSTINYGSKPGQTERIVKYNWEIPFELYKKWQYIESTPSEILPFSGKEKICLSITEIKNQKIKEFGLCSSDIFGLKGIIISQMNEMFFSIYLGYLFDNNTSVIWPKKEKFLTGIFSYLESGEYINEIRKRNKKLDVAAHTMVKVPFDLEYWQKIAKEKYPNGLPMPYSDDPTQWIFHGHPAQSDHPLQVAVARLLGYRWPAEQDEKMELSDDARHWIKQCANLVEHIDKDGIVCIPPVRGELSAAERLLNLLAAAYGNQWNMSTLNRLLQKTGHEGRDLESWLREKFFSQHCAIFHHRPFIWNIWDGLRDGFSVLVNYHKLDRKNMESLIYLYLEDWINNKKEEQNKGIDGAFEKLQAAENLKKQLNLILEGEKPYDIFVRWKPLEKQPKGWDPDLNDGVRLNIRPFMSVADIRKKGAGILRDKPNIEWNKDRGKDVESSPWFKIFKGERINDYHLSLSEKMVTNDN